MNDASVDNEITGSPLSEMVALEIVTSGSENSHKLHYSLDFNKSVAV